MKKCFFFLIGVLLLSGCSAAGNEQSASNASSTAEKTSALQTTSVPFGTIEDTKESHSIAENVTDQSNTNVASNSDANSTQTSKISKEDTYYDEIKAAWQKQKDYIDSVTDQKTKQSLQTSFAAANSEANYLEMQYPEDVELIKDALKKVLDGE